MLRPDETHPEYIFDPSIKHQKYNHIIKALADKKVLLACTFPGLSNFSLERKLIEKYPGIRIHCFEKDYKIYLNILESFEKPSAITLIHDQAENFIGSVPVQYDFIWFDYCGGPHEEISNLINDHLTDRGVFAITNINGRGYKYPPFHHKNFKQSINTFHYNRMEFRAFTKTSKTLDIITINRVIEAKSSKHSRHTRATWTSVINEVVNEIKAKKIIEKTPQLKVIEDVSQLLKSLGGLPAVADKIPANDVKLLNLYLAGRSQVTLAREFNLTQGNISHRIHRVIERLKFLKDFPIVSDDELNILKSEFSCMDIDIIKGMQTTTCQSKTADLVNAKYNLKEPKERMNQIKVRHRLGKYLTKLETLQASNPVYARVCKMLTMARDNLYMLHEVKFTQEHNKHTSEALVKSHSNKKLHQLRDENLKVLLPILDWGMIDLIDTMMAKHNFDEAAKDMNQRRWGNLKTTKYTEEKVENCWYLLKDKLKKVSRIPGYEFLQPIYTKMEGPINGNTNTNVLRRPESVLGSEPCGDMQDRTRCVLELR